MELNTFDLYLFGGTGDLSNRKLIPAMFRQETLGSIDDASQIIGIGSRDLSTEEYISMVNESLNKYYFDLLITSSAYQFISAIIPSRVLSSAPPS